MAKQAQAPAVRESGLSPQLFVVIAFGLVVAAFFAYMMWYAYWATPGKPFDMMG